MRYKKDPNKTRLNSAIRDEIHSKAKKNAIDKKITLNEYVEKAIAFYNESIEKNKLKGGE